MKNRSTLPWASTQACYTPVEMRVTEDLHSHVLTEEPNEGGEPVGRPGWIRIVHSIQAGTCHSMLAPLCELGFRWVFLRDVCDETIEKGMDQDPSRAAVTLLMDTRTMGRLYNVTASSGTAGMLPFSHFTEFNTLLLARL